jgi:hypothetical protein
MTPESRNSRFREASLLGNASENTFPRYLILTTIEEVLGPVFLIGSDSNKCGASSERPAPSLNEEEASFPNT